MDEDYGQAIWATYFTTWLPWVKTFCFYPIWTFDSVYACCLSSSCYVVLWSTWCGLLAGLPLGAKRLLLGLLWSHLVTGLNKPWSHSLFWKGKCSILVALHCVFHLIDFLWGKGLRSRSGYRATGPHSSQCTVSPFCWKSQNLRMTEVGRAFWVH